MEKSAGKKSASVANKKCYRNVIYSNEPVFRTRDEA